MTTADSSSAPWTSVVPPPSSFTVEEIRELVGAFERCDLPRAAWTHHAHLVTALWYLVHYGPAEGGARVRDGIRRLNAANGVPQTRDGGYHETITCFYLCAIARHIHNARPGTSITDLAATLIDAWGDKNRPLEYYSRERLFSLEARTGWVEPDLKAMESAGQQDGLEGSK
jgi:hypothetical protein